MTPEWPLRRIRYRVHFIGGSCSPDGIRSVRAQTEPAANGSVSESETNHNDVCPILRFDFQRPRLSEIVFLVPVERSGTNRDRRVFSLQLESRVLESNRRRSHSHAHGRIFAVPDSAIANASLHT
jgi:hypothetical protein